MSFLDGIKRFGDEVMKAMARKNAAAIVGLWRCTGVRGFCRFEQGTEDREIVAIFVDQDGDPLAIARGVMYGAVADVVFACPDRNDEIIGARGFLFLSGDCTTIRVDVSGADGWPLFTTETLVR